MRTRNWLMLTRMLMYAVMWIAFIWHGFQVFYGGVTPVPWWCWIMPVASLTDLVNWDWRTNCKDEPSPEYLRMSGTGHFNAKRRS